MSEDKVKDEANTCPSELSKRGEYADYIRSNLIVGVGEEKGEIYLPIDFSSKTANDEVRVTDFMSSNGGWSSNVNINIYAGYRDGASNYGISYEDSAGDYHKLTRDPDIIKAFERAVVEIAEDCTLTRDEADTLITMAEDVRDNGELDGSYTPDKSLPNNKTPSGHEL